MYCENKIITFPVFYFVFIETNFHPLPSCYNLIYKNARLIYNLQVVAQICIIVEYHCTHIIIYLLATGILPT
jgi:hypothetical protein